ncbi:hypothetical protein LTR62_004549 [Meristemomyces frigidus]|uniref:N-end rule aminoacyl transferase C-terminal domain-containing protein n=1 Tax=Meristemomyces frigidus TaxID=1508187 RepID=A0AAN7THH9_9PEZI|nr:hypothetical protein LTR62_004549 [Meristemomyces frigidus]
MLRTRYRLPAAEFKPSRDQRQVLYRWNRFVLGEKYIKEVERKFPKTKAEKKKQEAQFDLVATIHESEHDRLKPDIPPEHNFTVTLESDNFTEEKYALFANYQKHVHHEKDSDVSRPGFTRFLCNSPLHRHTGASGQELGSYHQCYRLDGRLVALGVVDLLPHAVSGVYFLYHSDYEKWSLGKLSALRETALALEDSYQYYYMGYYIHGCAKMRYKGDYKPQYVLDYGSGGWDVLDEEMRRLMGERKWVSMSREKARSRPDSDSTAPVPASGEIGASDRLKAETTSPPPPNNDPPILHPTPLAATESNLSLLELGMPGVLTLPEVLATINLDTMKLFLGGKPGGIHEMQDLVSWGGERIVLVEYGKGDADGEGEGRGEMGGMKKSIAELAACIGARVAAEVVVDFSRG